MSPPCVLAFHSFFNALMFVAVSLNPSLLAGELVSLGYLQFFIVNVLGGLHTIYLSIWMSPL